MFNGDIADETKVYHCEMFCCLPGNEKLLGLKWSPEQALTIGTIGAVVRLAQRRMHFLGNKLQNPGNEGFHTQGWAVVLKGIGQTSPEPDCHLQSSTYEPLEDWTTDYCN